MGKMSILSSEGDTEICWDPDSPKSIANAKKRFDDYIGKGFAAFRMSKKGKKKGSKISAFPSDAGELLLIPPIAGG